MGRKGFTYYPRELLGTMKRVWLKPLSRSTPIAPDGLLDVFERFPVAEKNRVMNRLVESMFKNGDSYLYAFSIYRLYARYLEYFLPGRKGLQVLEIGPGRSLVTAIFWAGHPAVQTITLIDKYASDLLLDNYYYLYVIDFINIIMSLPRAGYFNSFPLEDFDLERCKRSFKLGKTGIVFDGSIIRYVVHPSPGAWNLDDDSFDFVYSHATLEHVDDPLAMIREVGRVLRPGGITVHQIDLRDHRFPDDPFKFLTLRDAEWAKEEEACTYRLNRWRADGFREAFSSVGLKILWEDSVCSAQIETVAGRLDRRFQEIPREELSKVGVRFVLRKDTARAR